MEAKRVPFYLGIDLNDRYAMISTFQPNMKEPSTISTILGSELYQIAVLLAKRKGLGQWYYGEDAVKMAKTSEMICVDALLRRALAGESIQLEGESYEAEELLVLFLKKLIQLSQKLGNPIYCDKLVITVERLTKENMELFWRIAPKLGFSREQFMVIDHRESFYYFALCQQDAICMHDVFLFEYEQDHLSYMGLSRNKRTRPQVVTIDEGSRTTMGEDRDADFLRVLQRAFDSRVVSSVFLSGEGFETDWMKNSKSFLCRGRRAFIGKNIFTQGACYAASVRAGDRPWPYIYMGENEMKFNICLMVKKQGKPVLFDLIEAGKNWFETSGECEVVLSGNTEIAFYKKLPNGTEAKLETLELTDLPRRPDRATRLRITAKPVADDKVEIIIRDLGFGEFFRSSDKSWRYTMSI